MFVCDQLPKTATTQDSLTSTRARVVSTSPKIAADLKHTTRGIHTLLQSGEGSKTLQLVVSDTCVITRADRLPDLNGHKETGEGEGEGGGREGRRAEGEEGEKGGRGGRGGREGRKGEKGRKGRREEGEGRKGRGGGPSTWRQAARQRHKRRQSGLLISSLASHSVQTAAFQC